MRTVFDGGGIKKILSSQSIVPHIINKKLKKNSHIYLFFLQNLYTFAVDINAFIIRCKSNLERHCAVIQNENVENFQ